MKKAMNLPRVKVKFNDLPWDDACLMGLHIDRSRPGHQDEIGIDIAWGSGRRQRLVFSDCYQCNIAMNMGVIAEEKLLHADAVSVKDKDEQFLQKWARIGVDLASLLCFSFVTEATHSKIEIYALQFILLDL
ncbi:hypothetical protein [Vandammella animalimorsus]|nr:hypothetical protein [Vandammella animalimorsus]